MSDMLKSDFERAVALAELKARVDSHDEAIARHDMHIARLDETVSILRETVAKVATKDDIMDFRLDISEKIERKMSDALKSVPAKQASLYTAGMLIIALLGLVVNMIKSKI